MTWIYSAPSHELFVSEQGFTPAIFFNKHLIPLAEMLEGFFMRSKN